MSNHLSKNSVATIVAIGLATFLTSTESPAQSTPAEISGWGRFEDPSGQAKVEATASRLTITSGKNELRARSLGLVPRIVREVDGDFDVQVHVRGEFTEEYQSGVLIAYKSPQEYFSVKSGSGRYRVKEVGTTVMTRSVIKGGAHQPRKSGSNWIRLQRIGDELASYYSDDGKDWMLSRRTSDTLFVGTDYDIGDRAIILLVDGKPVLDVRESCLSTGFPETDARAFARLYEHLASQARREFRD
jgi:hypothetical protein